MSKHYVIISLMDIETANVLSSPSTTAVLIIIIVGSGLWKSYLGPILASIFGFSLLEAFAMTMTVGLLSAKFSSLLSQFLLGLLRQIRNQPYKAAAHFNPRLRKLLRFWQRFGLPIAAFIAPTIIGIPTYSFIARRLQTSPNSMYTWLSISLALWILVSYYLGHYLIESGLIDLAPLLALLKQTAI